MKNTNSEYENEIVVKGKLFKINEKDILKNIKNKIILIEKADPGFDWIFSKKIKALITKYGGVNSHMSIKFSKN